MVNTKKTDKEQEQKNESINNSVTMLIIEKNCTIKSVTIKNYQEEELYKKCGFKKKEGFEKKITWNVKIEGKKYHIHVFAKEEGKSNFENKYDFPPPIDKNLFFGSCALMAQIANEENILQYVPLTTSLWEKIYEHLFGGFEDLTKITNDDEEEDELENIPLSKKTKIGGYLKDGFVVDDYEDDECDEDSDEDENSETEYHEEEKINVLEKEEEILQLEDIGSELSEESYLYSSDEDE